MKTFRFVDWWREGSFVRWVVWAIASFFGSRTLLVAEDLCLRQQLLVMGRKPSRPRSQDRDRRFWLLVSRWFPGWQETLLIAPPETVVRWHRGGWKAYWRWRSRPRGRPGRKPVSPEGKALIRPTSEWTGRQIVEACGWDRKRPRFLIHDRDSRYGAVF